MPLIIDGHNLIPKIDGMSLKDLDDEMRLIKLLQVYATKHRKNIEVFFDKGLSGYSSDRQFGLVKANFVHSNSTADKAIIKRLGTIKDSPHNWTVVSSDHWVINTARQMGARIMSSKAFAKLLCNSRYENEDVGNDVKALTEEQVEEWLDIFSSRNKD